MRILSALVAVTTLGLLLTGAISFFLQYERTLASIDGDGAASMAFHTHPFIMDFDPHSGDYGLAFVGHALHGGADSHPPSP